MRLFLIILIIELYISLVFSVFSRFTIFKFNSWRLLLLLVNLSILDFKLKNEKGLFIDVISKYLKILISKLFKLLLEINIIDIFLLISLISEKVLIIFSIKLSSNNIISILFSIIVSFMLIRLFLKNLFLYKPLKYFFNRNKKLSSLSMNKILMTISCF